MLSLFLGVLSMLRKKKKWKIPCLSPFLVVPSFAFIMVWHICICVKVELSYTSLVFMLFLISFRACLFYDANAICANNNEWMGMPTMHFTDLAVSATKHKAYFIDKTTKKEKRRRQDVCHTETCMYWRTEGGDVCEDSSDRNVSTRSFFKILFLNKKTAVATCNFLFLKRFLLHPGSHTCLPSSFFPSLVEKRLPLPITCIVVCNS